MRRSVVLGVLVVLAVGATACRVPSPLTYPLLFTQPVDALDEVEQAARRPATAGADSGRRRPHPGGQAHPAERGCEVLTIAQVIWVLPSEGPIEPASAAIEARGLCDDSVAGIWYEITMQGDDELGWVVATATRQDICARGVSGSV